MHRNLFVIFILIATFCNNIHCQDLPVIDELIIEKYLGQWFETHSNSIVKATFERNLTCQTANYALYDRDTISVYNHGNVYVPGGEISDIRGFASFTNTTGILDLRFPGVGAEGIYWIMKLGPEVHGPIGQYAYSLITDNAGLQVFVLARDIADFKANYEEEALQFLYDNGFNTPVKEPLESEHTNDCIYPATP